MEEIIKKNILERAKMDLKNNPNRGAINSIKDAAQFYDIDLSEVEAKQLVYELLFIEMDLDF